MLKNQDGQYFYAIAFNADGRYPGLTPALLSNTLSKDGAAAVALADTTPEETGVGIYRWSLLKEETNCNEQVFDPQTSVLGVELLGSPDNVIYPRSTDTDTPGGDPLSDIVIGDDYTASNNRPFTWTVVPLSGSTITVGTCRFGGYNKKTGDAWIVSGTATDIGNGEFLLSADLPGLITEPFTAGTFFYSVEIVNDVGDEETVKIGRVRLVDKQTI